MATKSIKKSNKQSTADMLKNKTKNFNEVALKTSTEIVDETIATGEQWQNLLAKTLVKGTDLFGQQQDLVLTGLETLKDQFSYTNKRLKKLLTFEPIKSNTPKPATKKSTATAKTTKNIDEVMEAATKAGKVEKKTANAKRASKAKAPKNLAAATKKATPKKKATPSTTAKKTNLTLIEGIGSKIQELLNKAGIVNFDQLAIKTPATLKKILTDAGTRFQMHDPSTWAAQAKLASAGRMEELKVLQAELKGGK